MDRKSFKEALAELRKISQKRNFVQSVDLNINLREINIKKAEENIDAFITLPNKLENKIKICALVSKDAIDKANVFDKVISEEEFADYKDKKEINHLAKSYDLFVASPKIMAKVATVFGRVLGSKGKMPNPKASQILIPTLDFKELKDKLLRTVRLKTNKEAIVKCQIGKENLTDDQLADNFMIVYNALVRALPREENNIKNVSIKTTMSKPVLVK